MIYCILGEGFEETEAVSPVDILRRGGLNVQFAGVSSKNVKGAHNIEICCETTVDKINAAEVEMLILPGGMKGVRSIEASRRALELIKSVYGAGNFVAAICAAPTILGKLGIMKGVRGVCYPGMEADVDGMLPVPGSSSVRDGNIITGRAPGAAMDFGFELLRALKGEAEAVKIREDMVY